MDQEKPNTGKVVKKVLKKKPVDNFQSLLTGITVDEFNSKAKELGMDISYYLAQAAEKQWHEKGGDVSRLSDMAKTYVEQLDEIVVAINNEQSDKTNAPLATSLSEVQKTDSVIEGYVTQTKYDRLEQALRKVQSQKDGLQRVCSELEKSFHTAHKDSQKSQKDLEELRALYETSAQTESPKTLEDHVSKEEYEKLKENHVFAQQAFQIAQKNEEKLEQQNIVLQQTINTYEAQIKTLDKQNTSLQQAAQGQQIKVETLEEHNIDLSESFDTIQKNEKQLEDENNTLHKRLEDYEATNKELQVRNEELTLVNKDLEVEIEEYKVRTESAPSASLTDEQKEKQYQTEIKALRDELANAYDNVRLLENRLQERNVATAGGTIKDTSAEVEEMESVQDGQEFSGTPHSAPELPAYELHPQHGLVTLIDLEYKVPICERVILHKPPRVLRYIPDTDGYLFDVDNKKRIGVGKDYQRCVDKHNANLRTYINGEPKSKSKDIEDLPVDSEE